jgi:hypothetical protein
VAGKFNADEVSCICIEVLYGVRVAASEIEALKGPTGLSRRGDDIGVYITVSAGEVKRVLARLGATLAKAASRLRRGFGKLSGVNGT